jgi:hypothetical protein
LKPTFLLLLTAASLGAAEITTGSMLGSRYDARAFYVRMRPNEGWHKTYSDAQYRTQAQGKLMNLRLCQALFHDEWMNEQPFDADRNTDSLIAALDFYKSHGVLMINISLQGGQAGYEKNVNGVDRLNGYRYGPEKGTHVSAFRADGSLKPEWLARLERLLRAADQRGMIVTIMYFYQGQDELFESTEAIHTAARNATDWLVARNFRNVMIDVANEYDLRGDTWDFDHYIPRHIPQLIEEIRARFRKTDFLPPIGASSDGRMQYPESLMKIVDMVLIHGNGRKPEQKLARVKELKSVPRPILMNEDDNGRPSTADHLAGDLKSCDILFEGAAGWGYMPWVQAQRFPFRFLPGPKPDVRDDMPEKDRDVAYFHAVLDHVGSLTLKKRITE